LDQVMKIKNNRKDWPYVIEELRGENKWYINIKSVLYFL
jgi:hypothetical protein